MIYAMSDIHGEHSKYLEMLGKLDLKETDRLYILGDVIDRAGGGIETLLDMMKRANVVPILGNHEHSAVKLMKAFVDHPGDTGMIRSTAAYALWMANGGDETEDAFLSLDIGDQEKLVEYINSFRLYEELTAGGKTFHLSHSIPSFLRGRDIHSVSVFEFVWGEPDYGRRYNEKKIFVTGHTPTALIDPAYSGRIWQKNGHIAIDCGAAFTDGRLGCICLDTMEEFYV
ncbi:MAG: metallophosphoesterase [Clostridia bacterium]|nr:metallophosphoesterase [Clostridia bacterium]